MALVEKIKARLKAKWPKANLSTQRMDTIAAILAAKLTDDADDAAVDMELDTANGYMSFEEIARQDDQIRTLKAPKPTDPPKPADPANPPADPANPKLADPDDKINKLLEGIKVLTDKVESLEKGKALESKSANAKKAIESSDFFKKLKPEARERWLKRIDLDSETAYEDQVKELETELSDLIQASADNGNYAGPPPAGNPPAPSAEQIDAIVDAI